MSRATTLSDVVIKKNGKEKAIELIKRAVSFNKKQTDVIEDRIYTDYKHTCGYYINNAGCSKCLFSGPNRIDRRIVKWIKEPYYITDNNKFEFICTILTVGILLLTIYISFNIMFKDCEIQVVPLPNKIVKKEDLDFLNLLNNQVATKGKLVVSSIVTAYALWNVFKRTTNNNCNAHNRIATSN